MEKWTLFFNALSACSTFAMAIFAFKALDSWKNQQKRNKLIGLLESLNKYIRELQLYELESIAYSKQAKNISNKDFSNMEFLNTQIKLIDNEMAEEFGNCILCLKNWLIDHDEQKQILNEINKKMQEYRIKIYDYNILKANFLFNFHQPENIIYGQEQNLSKEMLDSKANLAKTRESLSETINEFKNLNKKLLK